MNNLSRNTPIAFVVGAAGFLGSHLVDKLLSKGIQVIGVDNLSTGRIENLQGAVKDKNFHFINQSAYLPIPIDFPRLDYAFFAISIDYDKDYQISWRKFLQICETFKPKILLISSIELYDRHQGDFIKLQQAEQELARFAAENKINARVVRLAAVYGSRMHFRYDDPIVKVIQAAALGEIQKEYFPLDFITRAIFIDDAIDLLIKAILHGATAHKIYDGALYHPIKVSEVKQVLLDPIWHENQNFTPTNLPPWPTPNLEKTHKELNWQTKTSIIKALKETLTYFKEYSELVPKLEKAVSFKPDEEIIEKPLEVIEEKQQKYNFPKIKLPKINIKKNLLLIGGLMLITYALIIPLGEFIANFASLRSYLLQNNQYAKNFNYQESEEKITKVKINTKQVGELISFIKPVTEITPFKDYFKKVSNSQQTMEKLLDNQIYTIQAFKNFTEVMQSLSGEDEGDIQSKIEPLLINLSQSDQSLSLIKISFQDNQILGFVTSLFFTKNQDFKLSIGEAQTNTAKARQFVSILPTIFASNSQKNYLIILRDNNQIRADGGKIIATAIVNFKQGKLISIKADDNIISQNLEGSLKNGGADEIDLPTNNRLLSWFYQKQTNQPVSGVISLDLTSLQKITEIIGPVNLTNTKNQQNQDYSLMLNELLNRLFFVPKQDWLKIAGVLQQQLAEKHLTIYWSDPQLLAISFAQDWLKTFPKQENTQKGEYEIFVSLIETKLDNKISPLPGRAVSLISNLASDGTIEYKLEINYSAFGQDNYQSKLKIYLPMGVSLSRALWGEADITKKISSISDHGRAGFLINIDLQPKESQKLTLIYKDQKPVQLNNDGIKIKVNLIKQYGVGDSKFDFKLNYTNDFQVVQAENMFITENEIKYSTDLSKDQNFEIDLKKAPRL